MAREGQIPNQIHWDAFKEKSGVIWNAFKENRGYFGTRLIKEIGLGNRQKQCKFSSKNR